MLSFDEFKDTGKTKVYLVHSTAVQLGSVKWFPQWRRYCFWPARETLFDAICLREIVQFIESLMAERK